MKRLTLLGGAVWRILPISVPLQPHISMVVRALIGSAPGRATNPRRRVDACCDRRLLHACYATKRPERIIRSGHPTPDEPRAGEDLAQSQTIV